LNRESSVFVFIYKQVLWRSTLPEYRNTNVLICIFVSFSIQCVLKLWCDDHKPIRTIVVKRTSIRVVLRWVTSWKSNSKESETNNNVLLMVNRYVQYWSQKKGIAKLSLELTKSCYRIYIYIYIYIWESVRICVCRDRAWSMH